MMPGFLLGFVLAAAGVGMVLAALTVSYRDFRYVVPFLIQLWMFVTPVLYPTTIVPERWRPFYYLNPMAGLIDGFRMALTAGRSRGPTWCPRWASRRSSSWPGRPASARWRSGLLTSSDARSEPDASVRVARGRSAPADAVAIRVDSLSKSYRLGALARGNRTFREAIMGAVAAPVALPRAEERPRRVRPRPSGPSRT